MERQGAVTYLINDGDRQVATFTSFERSPCTVDGVEYLFTREKTDRFWAEGPAGVAGVAHRVAKDEILVSAAPHELVLRRGGRMLARRWEMHEGGRVHGDGIIKAMRGGWDLPAHLPLPLRVFVLYVVVTHEAGHGPGLALWA